MAITENELHHQSYVLRSLRLPLPLTTIAVSHWWTFFVQIYLPYFIKYIAHTSTVRTRISQCFLVKKLFLFLKNNFKRNNHCKYIHHKNYLIPSLTYLPCIVCRKYFSINFNVKKNCALCGMIVSKSLGRPSA
jgi:hypothetical protein